MFDENLMRIMQAEREREIEARLRVHKLLSGRRPFIRRLERRGHRVVARHVHPHPG